MPQTLQPRLASSYPASDLSSRTLLVLTQIFAEDHILLLKRGLEPYRGKWAPPGGFVERGESSQAAAVREVWEEYESFWSRASSGGIRQLMCRSSTSSTIFTRFTSREGSLPRR